MDCKTKLNTTKTILLKAPKLPFSSAKIEENSKQKLVKNRFDSLYVDNKEIALLDTSKIFSRGHSMRETMGMKNIVSASVLDVLMLGRELIPKDWEKLEKTVYIFFWGTIFRGLFGSLYVKYLYFDGNTWNEHYFWLGSKWSGNSFATIIK